MRCVLLEVEEEVEEKKKVITKTCHAGIGTSEWKLDEATTKAMCETDKFENCPRLRIFMNHAIGTSKLKVDTSQ